MFVANFDFSEYELLAKFLSINIPVVLTELLTYPLQRIQVQLIMKEPYVTRSIFQEMSLLVREMLSLEGFPKLLHGVRYSLDYTMTQMTTKFFVFDYLLLATKDITNTHIYSYCLLANTLSTVLSQSAFNYQTIASSLAPDSRNRNENVRERLFKYTTNKCVPLIGLRYTLPVSIINSVTELVLLRQARSFAEGKENSEHAMSYSLLEFTTAALTLLATSFASHYAVQRQLEVCFDLKKRFKYSKGLVGTILRNTFKGMVLYGVYFLYFELKMKR